MKRVGQTLLLLSLIMAVGLITLEAYRPYSAITARAVEPVSQTVAAPSSLRRIYPYSVVPGGVYSSAELRKATTDDPLVREHYRDFQLSRTRLVVLRQYRRQYVSYRMNGQILWTKKRLLIPKGEMLLTDGVHYARTRCGNRLSDTPQNETSSVEPDNGTLASDPIHIEMTQATPQPGQHSSPYTDAREVKSFVPGKDAPALLSSSKGTASPMGLVSSPFSRDYITSPAVAAALPLTNGRSPMTPVEVLVSPPVEPAVVPEPGTLYLFGLTGISSLAALLWLGRPRRQ